VLQRLGAGAADFPPGPRHMGKIDMACSEP
jgi:hypothetical protein